LNFHKKLVGVGFLVLISASLFAQARKIENLPTYDQSKYHFGFTLAVNQMHFTIQPVEGLNFLRFDANQSSEINADSAYIYSIENQPSFGFTVGIIANLRLGEYSDLRFLPSLSFGERTLNYRFLKYRAGVPDVIEIDKNVSSTFIELPLHLKYKSQRLNNFRAYILNGPNLRIDLASEAGKNTDAAQIQLKLNPYDFAYEIGVGFDFYFEWFKFGTEIKMSYGLLDILKREKNIYTDGIEKLRSKIFQFSFTFE
jgi:hypothetical protein